MPSMLRKILGGNVDTLNSSERASVTRLAASHRQLVVDAGRLDTKSEAGYAACATALADLDGAARSFSLQPSPRLYRMEFTINYRTLFPNEARSYRVDMLEASMEHHAAMWVNGEKFEFSEEAMRRAEALRRYWLELSQLLERWHDAQRSGGPSRPSRSEFSCVLGAIDSAWARFEHKYISELIGIEERARSLVLEAVKHERHLRVLEKRHGPEERAPWAMGPVHEALQEIPEYVAEQRRLVSCVCRLNSVANYRRKGRDDLSADVLRDAERQLEVMAHGGELRAPAAAAARLLAEDVVESFASMRRYLQELEKCIERVDPHLCNNPGLVAKLVDWEESWEVGMRYVQRPPLLAALCEVVAEVQCMEAAAPELNAMVEDCDVELFLVLPRIVWMRFLSAEAAQRPAEPSHAELLRSLLPHRFAGEGGAPSRDLKDFVQMYKHARQVIAAERSGVDLPGCAVPSDAAASSAWDVLTQRVVNGCSAPGGPEPAEAALRDFMRELERWSIELQRHCPEDWNQCCALLVQCLVGGSQKERDSPFRI